MWTHWKIERHVAEPSMCFAQAVSPWSHSHGGNHIASWWIVDADGNRIWFVELCTELLGHRMQRKRNEFVEYHVSVGETTTDDGVVGLFSPEDVRLLGELYQTREEAKSTIEQFLDGLGRVDT